MDLSPENLDEKINVAGITIYHLDISDAAARSWLNPKVPYLISKRDLLESLNHIDRKIRNFQTARENTIKLLKGEPLS